MAKFTIFQTTNPTAPPENYTSLFVDSTDGHIKTIDENGTVVDLQKQSEWTYLGEYTGNSIDLSSIPTGSLVRIVYYQKNDYGYGAIQSFVAQFNSLSSGYENRYLGPASNSFVVKKGESAITVAEVSSPGVDIAVSGELLFGIDCMYDSRRSIYSVGYSNNNHTSTEGSHTKFLESGLNEKIRDNRVNSISFTEHLDHVNYKVYYKCIKNNLS